MAELHRLSEQTQFTYNVEGVKKLKDALAFTQARPDEAVSEVEAMRAEMEQAAGITRETPSEAESATSPTDRIDNAMADMMALRQEIEGRASNDSRAD